MGIPHMPHEHRLAVSYTQSTGFAVRSLPADLSGAKDDIASCLSVMNDSVPSWHRAIPPLLYLLGITGLASMVIQFLCIFSDWPGRDWLILASAAFCGSALLFTTTILLLKCAESSVVKHGAAVLTTYLESHTRRSGAAWRCELEDAATQSNDLVQSLQNLHELHTKNALTDEEFRLAKSFVIRRRGCGPKLILVITLDNNGSSMATPSSPPTYLSPHHVPSGSAAALSKRNDEGFHLLIGNDLDDSMNQV